MPEGNDVILLVQKAQSGDQPAFEQLVRQYARLVWAVVYGIVHDAAWTEDIVQDTFMKAYQSIKAVREPASFKGWLVQIARRNAFQHNERLERNDKALSEASRTLKSATTINVVVEDFSAPLWRDGSASGGSPRVTNDDFRQQLHTTLRELPERYRIPLTLRYLEGFNYKQISDELGLTDGSLRGLLNRGIKLLREEVKFNK